MWEVLKGPVLVTHKLRLIPVRSHSVAHGFPQALNGHCSCYTYSILHVHQQTWLSTSTCSDCDADCLVFRFQNSSCGSFSCDYTCWCSLCVSLTFLFFFCTDLLDNINVKMMKILFFPLDLLTLIITTIIETSDILCSWNFKFWLSDLHFYNEKWFVRGGGVNFEENILEISWIF